MSGWIRLHRQIKNHWIWQDPVKFQWWLDLLLSANYAPAKVLIGSKLIDCDRGQTIRSLTQWAQRWHTSKDSTRNFLTLLKNDGMIHTENMVKTTRITICNYDSYNTDSHDSQTQAKRKTNASQTLPIHKQEELIITEEEQKEEIKDVRFNFKHELFKLSGNQDLVNDWMAVRKTKRATNTKTAFDGFLSEVVKSGLDINDVLRKCVMQSWSGFKAEWTTKNNNLNIIHHEQFAELTTALRQEDPRL